MTIERTTYAGSLQIHVRLCECDFLLLFSFRFRLARLLGIVVCHSAYMPLGRFFGVQHLQKKDFNGRACIHLQNWLVFIYAENDRMSECTLVLDSASSFLSSTSCSYSLGASQYSSSSSSSCSSVNDNIKVSVRFPKPLVFVQLAIFEPQKARHRLGLGSIQ